MNSYIFILTHKNKYYYYSVEETEFSFDVIINGDLQSSATPVKGDPVPLHGLGRNMHAVYINECRHNIHAHAIKI